MVFPLRLVPFERYLLADDRAELPMAFWLRLDFQGTFDRSTFEAAVEAAVERHPLLGALVECEACGPVRDRFSRWVAADGARPFLDWGDLDEPSGNYRDCPLDLTAMPGLRLWIRSSQSRTRVEAQFHHSVCDAIGAARFLDDLLVIYDAKLRGADPLDVLPPIDTAPLTRRGACGMTLTKFLLRLPLESLNVYRSLRFFWNRPVELTLPPDESAPATPFSDGPAFCTHRLTPDELTQLRARSHAAGVSINDLLIRDAMLVLDAWNEQQGVRPASRWGRSCLRVGMPVNFRVAAEAHAPAMNFITMVFLDRKNLRRSTPERTLHSLRNETGRIKRLRLGLSFIAAIAFADRFKRGLARLTRHDRCMATTVLTNIGVQFASSPIAGPDGRLVAGGAVLDGIEFLPPVWPLIPVSFGVVTYAQRLAISMAYDPQTVSAPLADQLMGNLIDRMNETVLGH